MSTHPRMTCRQFVEFLMDYVTNELPDATHQNFEWHLQACPDCVRYLESYKATITVCRRAFDVSEADLPVEVPEDLIQAILAAQRNL